MISAAVGVIVWTAASRFHQRHLAPVIDRAFFRQAYDTRQILAEQEAVISTGDVVVLMSDGLPERFNQQREMLDYAPIKQTFAEIAGQSPQEIIAQLINTGERWAGGRPQDDDITFVIIKITESK